MQMPLSESSPVSIRFFSSLFCSSVFCLSTLCRLFLFVVACFPAVCGVTVSAREKKVNIQNFVVEPHNTCNWMLMSTEYSLQSCKEMSLCFTQFLLCCIYFFVPMLDKLFVCGIRRFACALNKNSTDSVEKKCLLFAYKFIFFALFFRNAQKLQRNTLFACSLNIKEVIWQSMEAAIIYFVPHSFIRIAFGRVYRWYCTELNETAKWVAANWSLSVCVDADMRYVYETAARHSFVH